MKTVSVIVIVYNEEDSISDCISSILSQTYSDFELVIVNDGSTDKTENVINNFKDNRIIYTKHLKNKGYASARNTGLKLARGNLIFFTDADCIVDQDWIKNGVRILNSNPKTLAVYGILKSVLAAGKKGSITRGASYIIGVLNYVYPTPIMMNSVYRRSTFEKIGNFDERYNMGGEDLDLGLRVMKAGLVQKCEGMIVSHKPKEINLKRCISLARRQGFKVCLVKDHTRNYPKLRKSEICYKFIIAPSYFFPLFFPPLIFMAVKVKNKKITSLRDLAFLIPLYFGLWYARFMIWKISIRERIFLI